MSRSERVTTVTVQLPAKWMAEVFADWVADAFIENMLGNDGQRLITENTNSEFRIILVREGTEQPTQSSVLGPQS